MTGDQPVVDAPSTDSPAESRWYQLSGEATTDRLRVDRQQGLSAEDAHSRLERYGPNRLAEAKKDPEWRVFLRQFADFMQVMLIAAGVVSLIIDQVATAVLLFFLAVMNAILGYRQGAKAEESVAALQEMMQIDARVRRGGRITEVPADQLVPGDIVLVEAGDQVPADGRLLRAASLEIEESALTGESQPSPKELGSIADPEAPLGDRHNMAYMNTLVTRGAGTLAVTATGMDTEMGRIAGLLGSVTTEKSPLQRQLDSLVKAIAVVALVAMIIVIGAGIARGDTRDQILFLGIAVGIAAIPTGMPTVVTTMLSMGTQRLARSNAIVKDLTSVETLGSTSAICSDKTGTLTLNQMTARVLHYSGNRYEVTGEGYSTDGRIARVGGAGDISLDAVLLSAALCNDASVMDGNMVGDPTEGALVVLAAKGGLDVRATRQAYPRLAEVPFDSDYKFMATFHSMTDTDGRPVVRCYVKGAPSAVLDRCETLTWEGGERVPIADVHGRAMEANEELASEGLRVMFLASRDLDPDAFDASADLITVISGLTLQGMVGIVDPPRTEARAAIAEAHGAGIEVRMITGDHTATAAAIGHELGIEGEALRGAEMDELSHQQFQQRVEDIDVFGRVTPEHKVRLVETLQANGHVVAMTGDGVNDAPALKRADIGVAMGITGTEVSKQAANMILTDDNFATIVEAVRIGRVIWDNLMKYLRFQLSALAAWVLLYIGAAVFDIAGGVPLTPLQVLWIKFAVVVPPAIGLGYDTPSAGLMDHPPRPRHQGILNRNLLVRFAILGFVMAASTLTLLVLGPDEAQADQATVSGTMAFVAFSFALLFVALSSRSNVQTVFSRDTFSNPQLLRLLALPAVLTLLVTELGFLQGWFATVSLTGGQWAVALMVASLVLWIEEIRKLIARQRSAAAQLETLAPVGT